MIVKAIVVSAVLLASVIGSSQIYKGYHNSDSLAAKSNSSCFSPEGKFSVKSVKKSGSCGDVRDVSYDVALMQGKGVLPDGCQGTIQVSPNNCFVISDSTCHTLTCPGYTPDTWVRRQAITTWSPDGFTAKETLVGSIVDSSQKVLCSSVYDVVYERSAK